MLCHGTASAPSSGSYKCALPPGWQATAQALQCVALVCNHQLWTPALVAEAKALGLRCLSYTVNDEAEARRLISLGTDGIVSDAVDLFCPARGQAPADAQPGAAQGGATS